MKRIVASGVGLALGVVVALGLLAVAGRAAPQRHPYGTPIGPRMERDSGAGEMLVLVLGGVYATRAEAQAANTKMSFGDLAGYYVVPAAQFQGFRKQIGSRGGFALVSAFRTDQGAREFAALARSLGYPGRILSSRVRSLGGQYAGLGQEASPNGVGPLTGPTKASLP
jgi:hypothetical protein